MKHYIVLILASLLVAIAVFVVVEFLIIRFNGTPVAIPTINRSAQTVGSGPSLSYAIMGDSTSISQGSKYEDGFGAASIKHLSKRFTVTSINTGISGATTEDVRNDQLKQVAAFKPDLILLAAGANDVTHFTRGETIRISVQTIINELRRANPDIKIIVTSSPAMDSVSRFPNGAKQLMGLRTKQVNAVFHTLISKNNLISAPIAEKTRDAFIADPSLTASDNFHPNKSGYALWIPVINHAIDDATL
jgi:lysophospholipase L1-like esterase